MSHIKKFPIFMREKWDNIRRVIYSKVIKKKPLAIRGLWKCWQFPFKAFHGSRLVNVCQVESPGCLTILSRIVSQTIKSESAQHYKYQS